MKTCMLPLGEPVSITGLQPPHFEDGLILEKSSSSEHLGAIIDIGSTTSTRHSTSTPPVQEKKSSMPESLPANSETICNDKLTICLKNFQVPQLKKKLDRDLDSIGKAYNESLNSCVWDKYPRLLLHTRTALAGLDSTSLNGYVKSTTRLSWLKVQTSSLNPQTKSSLKTCSPSPIPLVVECTEIENSALKFPKIKNKTKLTQDPETLYASAKVTQLALTVEQKQYFSKLAYAHNLVYNRGVLVFNHKLDTCSELDPYKLRDDILRHFDDFDDFKYTEEQTAFLKSVPYRVKEKAAEQICTVLKATQTNWKKHRYNKKKKQRKRKDRRVQCKHVYTSGKHKGEQCDAKAFKKTQLCGKHKPKAPKIRCETEECKCMAIAGLTRCRKHTTEEDRLSLTCVYETKTGVRCKSKYVHIDSKKCEKHHEQSTCKYKDCEVQVSQDYCLTHAAKLNIKLKFRNRKTNKTFSLNERDWDAFIRRIKDIKDVKGDIVEKPVSEFTFVYNRTTRMWKMCSLEYKTKPEIEEGKKMLCSFDPGERVPYTMYSFDDGTFLEISDREQMEKRIVRLKNRCERLQNDKKCLKELYSDPKSKQKSRELRRLNRLIAKTTTKVSNLLKDAHWQLARMICSTYSYVILPIFKVAKIAHEMKVSRVPKFVRKNILAFGHFRFREIMKAAAAKFNTTLVLGTEFYTTKCCLLCRRLTDIGSSKVYKCRFDECGFEGPRDMVSAINNGLQYIR